MKLKITLALLMFSINAGAQPFETPFQVRPLGPADCGEMMMWNYSTAMCEGRAMADMPMTMLMVHGNAFAVGTLAEGPRGQNKFNAPNMLMADLGTSLGDRNYVNVDLMLTFEKWSYPESGYPLLLQIGEENENHQPYIDAQHPHSSPIMGLAFSDTYSFGENQDHFKLSFAPRGEATDGPTAFMHRASGLVNPDAPLGHHIGQDVGHITSTVLAAEIRKGGSNLEASTFYGAEPEPSHVDLPVSTPNSFAVRFTQRLSDEIHAMASAAYLKSPEAHDPSIDHIWRYSFSMYTNSKFKSGWHFNDTFIYGLTNFYEHAGALSSILYEALLMKERRNFWGRIEAVQRTPDELKIGGLADSMTGRFVELVTLGYTHTLWQKDGLQFQVGGSVTKDLLPTEYQAAYGGSSGPMSAKLFVQFGGMRMGELGESVSQ